MCASDSQIYRNENNKQCSNVMFLYLWKDADADTQRSGFCFESPVNLEYAVLYLSIICSVTYSMKQLIYLLLFGG